MRPTSMLEPPARASCSSPRGRSAAGPSGAAT